jgi:hypothetical protein
VSATTTTLIGCFDCVSCGSFGGSALVASAAGVAAVLLSSGFSSFFSGGLGGPSGKAVCTSPVMRAARVKRVFSGLKPLRMPTTSGIGPWNFSAGIFIAAGEVWISGSNLVFAPSRGCRMPAVAMLIWPRSAVIVSSLAKLALRRLSQAT